MDLEKFSEELHFMDPKNVTSILLNLIVSLGTANAARRNNHHPSTGIVISSADGMTIPILTDDREVLAHNLTTILMRHYSDERDADLWDAVLADLESEEHRWKESLNRRLGNIASTVLIVAYVSFSSLSIYKRLMRISYVYFFKVSLNKNPDIKIGVASSL